MKRLSYLRRAKGTLLYALIIAVLALAGCSAAQEAGSSAGYKTIDQATARTMMEKDDGHIVVDVRREDEYKAGHIPGAVLISNESIGSERPSQLPELDQIILIYCRSGNRSAQAAKKLAAMGYTNVYDFGGITTWTGAVVAENSAKEEELSMNHKTIYLAGGCFWGLQKFFDQFEGVLSTEVGYANGPGEAPSYEDVCNNSGHAETVKVVYDEGTLSLTSLLDYYFMVIDPTSVNRQGNDRGIQYRTGIYYSDEAQLPEIEAVYKAQEEKAGEALAVELGPIENFYSAEEYHQKYLDKNPGGYCHIPRDMFELSQTASEGSEEKPAWYIDYKNETDEELRVRIGDTAYGVTQFAETEYPYTGEYDSNFEKGLYVDIVSGEPLFTSMDKYNSGCGWPAFTRPISEDAVVENEDTSHGMVRTEVKSGEAGSHLGHVFEDGPEETGGLRYCINSAALRFIPYDQLEAEGYGDYISLFD